MNCNYTLCQRLIYAKGYCRGHYQQLSRGKDLSDLPESSVDKVCDEEDCPKVAVSKGLCGTHAWRRDHGKNVQLHDRSIKERLMNKTLKQDDGCWVWTGSKRGSNGAEYGSIRIGSKMESTHRVSYEEYIGPLLPGDTVDHLCRNTLCINPKHLEAVSIKENIRRMAAYRQVLMQNEMLRKQLLDLGYEPIC